MKDNVYCSYTISFVNVLLYSGFSSAQTSVTNDQPSNNTADSVYSDGWFIK